MDSTDAGTTHASIGRFRPDNESRLDRSEQNGVGKSWDDVSAGYSRYVTPTHFWMGNQGLRLAGLKAGMTFLDIAAGSGALSLPAARLGAEVLAIDLSPGMLEYLEAQAAEEGLDRVETRVMDGHNLALPSDTFDVAGSQYGIMLFPDFPRAVSEAVRVVKPGGRVFVTVYGFPHEIEFLSFFIQALKAVKPGFTGLPSDPPPHEFQAADPKVLSERLRAAGLNDVRVKSVTEELRFASGGELWDWIINSNPIAGMLTSDLGEEEIGAVIEGLERQVRTRSGSNAEAVLTNPTHIGLGVV